MISWRFFVLSIGYWVLGIGYWVLGIKGMATGVLNDIQGYARDLVNKHQIPALSIAIWKNEKLYKASSGTLNTETGVKATTDSIFQIGSITKVLVASLVMRLVDQGKVDLDAPVKTYLRCFQVADPVVTEKLTVRSLLNHTSGLMGDFFPDDQRAGGDAISRYVDRCYFLPQVHLVNEKFSYSNAAFAIVGRLIEVVTGTSWFDAMEEHIFKPLGMTHAVAHPMDVLRYRAAMGHISDPVDRGKWILPSKEYLSLGLAPAGTTVSMTASDLMRFAKAHLSGGFTPGGERWLSSDSVKRMQQAEIALPTNSPMFISDWGLGWFLINSKNPVNNGKICIIGHDGATIGQNAMLRLIPEYNLAFALQINATKSGVLKAIYCELMADLAGLTFEEPLLIKIHGKNETLSKFTGQFESFGAAYRIFFKEEKLVAIKNDRIFHSSPPIELTLFPNGEYSFAAITEEGAHLLNMMFVDQDEEGVPHSLFADYRLNRRV